MYFIGTYANGKPYYGSQPLFRRTKESINNNLEKLCSVFTPCTDMWGFWQKGWTDFDESKLDLYEVVEFRILASTSTTHLASEFFEISKEKKSA